LIFLAFAPARSRPDDSVGQLSSDTKDSISNGVRSAFFLSFRLPSYQRRVFPLFSESPRGLAFYFIHLDRHVLFRNITSEFVTKSSAAVAFRFMKVSSVYRVRDI